MSFSTTNRPPPEPWRPGMFSLDALKTHPGYDETPDRYPAPASAQPLGEFVRPSAAAPPPRKAIRAKRKVEEWRSVIHRQYAYLVDRTRDPERCAKLEELLKRTLKDGPDFARVRRNAEFKPVPVVAYSKEAANEILRQAQEIEDGSYATRDRRKFGGQIGRMGMQLLRCFCEDIWPNSPDGMTQSLAEIAERAHMSVTSVVAAMKRLAAFGFLTVQARRKRVPNPLGGVKVVQDTNAYVLGLANGLGELALATFRKKPKTPTAERAGYSSDARPLRAKLESYDPSYLSGRDWYPKPNYQPLLE